MVGGHKRLDGTPVVPTISTNNRVPIPPVPSKTLETSPVAYEPAMYAIRH